MPGQFRGGGGGSVCNASVGGVACGVGVGGVSSGMVTRAGVHRTTCIASFISATIFTTLITTTSATTLAPRNALLPQIRHHRPSAHEAIREQNLRGGLRRVRAGVLSLGLHEPVSLEEFGSGLFSEVGTGVLAGQVQSAGQLAVRVWWVACCVE